MFFISIENVYGEIKLDFFSSTFNTIITQNSLKYFKIKYHKRLYSP